MADYKGGYQIVEIETGLSGMYKKLEAAYNSGKPILVKKNGKISFGNVTKDGNYFVANYIIDDTLYQDTISALDAITDSSIDIGGSAGDIADIEDRFDANKMLLADAVDLSPYNTSTNLYTAPKDGYVVLKIKVSNTATDNAGLQVFDPGSASAYTGCFTRLFANPNGDQYATVMVKKGMRLSMSHNTGTGNACTYIPFS